jgi:IPTL-CTERM motif
MKKYLLGFITFAVVAGFGLSARVARAEVTCGPGDNWVVNCTQASDHTFPTQVIVGLDYNLDDVVDTTLTLSGDLTIHRTGSMQDSVFFPGTRGGPPPYCCSGAPFAFCTVDAECAPGVCNNCPGPNSRYIMDVNIVSMALTDGVNTLRAGAGLLPNGVTLGASQGAIAQKADDDTGAIDFFAIRGQVDKGPGTEPNRYLYTHGASFKMEGLTDRVPFNQTAYKVTPGSISLYSDPVGGIELARLRRLDHGPYGACCKPNFGCDLTLTDVECHAGGWIFEGPGATTCSHNSDGTCKKGACCRPNNGCNLDLTELQCEAISDGVFQGGGTTGCDHNPDGTCVKIGACCEPDNMCELNFTKEMCHLKVGGVFEGVGTTSCNHHPDGTCTKGACCRPNNVCTRDTTNDACVKLGGRYLGDGSTECAHDAAGNCIPTVSEWGLLVMAVLVLTAATVVIMRRRAMVHG